MKKFTVIMATLMFTSAVSFAQCIEKRSKEEGGVVSITSAESLFSGCKLRMCNYKKDGKTYYGIELDLTNRVSRVSRGNLLTIHFEDGSRISLSNLYDTNAKVDEETHVESFDHVSTDFVPVYDAWDDAVYTVPVDRRYREHVPVTTTTSFASLYYIISEHEINDIINKKISKISIVTDDETIVKKARPFSEAVAELFPLVK